MAGQKYYNQFKDDNLAKKLDMGGKVSAILFFFILNIKFSVLN